jgi:hypothetical protein
LIGAEIGIKTIAAVHNRSAQPMSAEGQNPNLPRRSIAVRFTLNKQTPTGGVQYEAMCQLET